MGSRLSPLVLLALLGVASLVSVFSGSSSLARASSRGSAARHEPQRVSTSHRGWKQHLGAVPILLYHGLGRPPAGAPFPQLYVSRADFVAEMGWLHRHGYEAVTLDDVMDAWFHGGRLPAKPVVITFDNGYVPQATFAPRVLGRYGWPGVLNEITADHLAPWRLRYLVSLGWEIDSHSVTHPDLTMLPPVKLRYEVGHSRRFLRRRLHVPVNAFCYPSSRYNPAVIAAVRAAGYTSALTENPGYATRANPFLLNRFEIEGGVSEVAADLSRGPTTSRPRG